MATLEVPKLVTTLNINDPVTLLHMRERATPKPRFLINHLLSIAPTDIVRTDEVLIDVKDRSGNKLAPFVVKGHKSTSRSGFKTELVKPSRIAPSRLLTLADTNKRIWLEGIADPLTQQERAMQLAIDDMTELVENTENSWEFLISQLIQTGKYTYTNVKSDKNGDDEETGEQTVDWTVDVLKEADWKYTPGTSWASESSNPIADLQAMARMMRRQGVAPTTLLLGSEAAAALISHPLVYKLLDNRRMQFGQITPRVVEQGGASYGSLIIDGLNVQLVDYAGEYVDGSGSVKPFIDPKNAVLTCEGSVRGIFAGVTQIEHCGENFTTRLAPMVPKYYSDVENDEYKLMLTSRPAFAPQMLGSFVASTVITD